jgi:hypothetical protein
LRWRLFAFAHTDHEEVAALDDPDLDLFLTQRADGPVPPSSRAAPWYEHAHVTDRTEEDT